MSLLPDGQIILTGFLAMEVFVFGVHILENKLFINSMIKELQ
jgi:hypothetical protein